MAVYRLREAQRPKEFAAPKMRTMWSKLFAAVSRSPSNNVFLCSQEGNRLPPVNAHCVRDVHGTAPVTYPWDRCTGCITYSKKGSDGMHTSWYKFGEEIVVKHLFTQNREDLQEEATQLFRDFQTDIELVGCRTSKGLSTGKNY